MTREQFLQVAEWVADGVCEGVRTDGTWLPREWLVDPKEPFSYYRKKPKPKLCPWRPGEVPFNAIFRDKAKIPDSGFSLLLGWNISRGFSFIENGDIRYAQPETLLAQCEHSLDHGKTWLPCGVMEG